MSFCYVNISIRPVLFWPSALRCPAQPQPVFPPSSVLRPLSCPLPLPQPPPLPILPQSSFLFPQSSLLHPPSSVLRPHLGLYLCLYLSSPAPAWLQTAAGPRPRASRGRKRSDRQRTDRVEAERFRTRTAGPVERTRTAPERSTARESPPARTMNDVRCTIERILRMAGFSQMRFPAPGFRD